MNMELIKRMKKFNSEHSSYAIKEIAFEDYKEEILSLRQRVWEQTDKAQMLQFYQNGFYSADDETAFHWGVFGKGQNLIASARLSKHYSLQSLPGYEKLPRDASFSISFPVASLNRLVVEKSLQNCGIGKILDEVRERKAVEIGCVSICVMSYGQRGNKLLNCGYNKLCLLVGSEDFVTDKEQAKGLPVAFFYKLLSEEPKVATKKPVIQSSGL